MSLTDHYGQLLNSLIPGGAHTYSKGSDQFPSNAPACIERGKGTKVWDADGNSFIDWSMGLTSICLGHANETINSAAIDAMALGHNFQRPSVMEAKAAEKLISFLDGRGEMVKFTKNGSTATTAAVKLSRAYTNRNMVGICAEHPFFSYDDWFIGSTQCNSGIPDPYKKLTAKFSFNDIDSLIEMFQKNKGQIACVIMEPVKFIAPLSGYLNQVYEVCKENGAIFILDEMVSGFKWSLRGAGEFYDGKADLYTWGKGMANGHSVCALTGKKDILELGGLTHDKKKVFLASTTHGAEIPQLAAMIKTLEIFEERPEIFSENRTKGISIIKHLTQEIANNRLNNYIEFIGDPCFFALNVKNCEKHFTKSQAKTYLMQELIKEGQLFQGLFYPTPFHSKNEIDSTYLAWHNALPKLRKFIDGDPSFGLIGSSVKPVFRRYNSCECNTAEDCRKCALKDTE